jgi:hypothetical protein
MRPDGSIEIDNALPYAKIQDQGGHIPAYDIVKAKGPGHVMRAKIDGKVRFFTKRTGFDLKAQNYVQAGINEWNATPEGAGLTAGWSDTGPGLPSPAISLARTVALTAAIQAVRNVAAKKFQEST